MKFKPRWIFLQLKIASRHVNINMKKDFKKIIEASHQTDRSLFNVVCIEKVGSGISPKADMAQTTIPIYLYEAFLVAGSTLFLSFVCWQNLVYTNGLLLYIFDMVYPMYRLILKYDDEAYNGALRKINFCYSRHL